MARCAERQLGETMSIPSSGSKPNVVRVATSRLNVPVRQSTSQLYLEQGRGNAPIRRDHDVQTNHPINIFRIVVPLVDTPMSPPLSIEDMWPSYDSMLPNYSYGPRADNVESLSTHFSGMALTQPTPLSGCSDCVV